MDVRVVYHQGQPCVSESGGGATNTGNACIVAGPHGEMKTGFRRDIGSCAYLPVSVGDLVITTEHQRGNHHLLVERITNINGEKADRELVAELRNEEWNPFPVPEELDAAIDAAFSKAECYHCNDLHYVNISGRPPRR